jgi:hypothetical protein
MCRYPEQPRARADRVLAKRSPPLKRHRERVRRKIIGALTPDPTSQVPVNGDEMPVEHAAERLRRRQRAGDDLGIRTPAHGVSARAHLLVDCPEPPAEFRPPDRAEFRRPEPPAERLRDDGRPAINGQDEHDQLARVAQPIERHTLRLASLGTHV